MPNPNQLMLSDCIMVRWKNCTLVPENLSVLPMALVILKLLGPMGIFYLFLVIFIGILKQQIWVEHGGIFAVLASPAGTLCTFLAMVTQFLITVPHNRSDGTDLDCSF